MADATPIRIAARSKWLLVLLGIVLAGAIFAWWSTSREKVVERESLNFRLKWVIYSSFGEHLVTHKMGFFEKENLAVNIRPGGAGLDPLRLVASGEDDVGLASYGQILMACEKGIPVVAFAQSNIASGVVFISLKDSGITEPQQFMGRKVGVIPGSDTGSVYAAVMTKLGIDRTKVSEVPIGFSVDPLLNKAVDVSTAAFSTNQPLAIASKGIAVNVIDPKKYGIEVGGNVFFTRADLLQKNPDILRRFLRAEFRGTAKALSMRNADVVSIVRAYNPTLDQAAEVNIWQATKDVLLPKTTVDIGVMPETMWKQTNDVFSASGLTSKTLDYRKCFTNNVAKDLKF